MAFLLLNDETGDMEGVVFPNVYKHCTSKIKEGALCLMEGKLEESFRSALELLLLVDSALDRAVA